MRLDLPQRTLTELELELELQLQAWTPTFSFSCAARTTTGMVKTRSSESPASRKLSG